MAEKPIKAGEVSVKVNVDVSDALKGLKAVQRLARETAESLKMAEAISLNIADTDRERYLLELFRLCKDNFEKDHTFSYREINEAVFQAVTEGGSFSAIYKDRCEGFTTSAIAAAKTFDNVVLAVDNKSRWERRREYGIPVYLAGDNLRGRPELRDKIVILDIEDFSYAQRVREETIRYYQAHPKAFAKLIVVSQRVEGGRERVYNRDK